MKAVGKTLYLNFAYYLQTDGEIERLNQYLELYLRCMTSQQPKTKAKWLATAKWWNNISYN